MIANSSSPARRAGRFVISAAALFACSLAAAAGDAQVPAQPIGDVVNALMGLDRSTLVHLDEAVPEVPYRATIRFDGRDYTMDLHPHSWRADDYKVYHSDANGDLTEVEPGPVNTFRGTLLEVPGTVVTAGVLAGDGLYGRISFDDGDEVWFEPVFEHIGPGSEGLHAVYRAQDVEPHDFKCGVTDVEAAVEPAANPQFAGTCDGQTFRAELAADADVRFFNRWGGNTESRINSVIGSMNNQYERDVDIVHVVSSVIIRTVQVYTTNDANGLLNQFRDRWLTNHTNIERDIAHLFTGRNLNGGTIGIAWLSVICDSRFSGTGFGLVQSDFNGNFSCATDLSAHELGHNWSAGHCDPCSSTMRSFIGCFNRFGSGSINAISNHRDSRTCLEFGPANDSCTNAIAIGDGSTGFNNCAATTDGDPLPQSCDEGAGRFIRKDVWFRYTATCSGTATASICNADFDNRLAVYRDGDCPGADLLSCNDFFCGVGGNRAETSFPVIAGQAYLVRIGSVLENGSGTLVLSCEEGPVCPEDFDGDGEVGFADLVDLLSNWGECDPPCPWDLNADGDVGFADLVQILSVWGPCEG